MRRRERCNAPPPCGHTRGAVGERECSAEERAAGFERLYRRYQRRVYAYALRRAEREVAQDAVADAFLAAWRRFEELPPDPLPWLLAATRKTLANQWRAAERQRRLAERVHREREPSYDPSDATATDAVLRAFAKLAPREREVLSLAAWEGLTPSQGARVLGVPSVVFRVRLHRARRKLEAALVDESRPAESRFHHVRNVEEVS